MMRVNKYLPCMGVALMASHDTRTMKRLSRQGWHLVGMAAQSALYRFKRGEPHAYEYCAVIGKRPSQELLTFYKESGWEPIAVEGDFHLLRSDNAAVPLYTDEATRREAIAENRRRYGLYATLSLCASVISLAILASMPIGTKDPLSCVTATLLVASLAVFGVCFAAFVAIVFNMRRSMEGC